MADNVNNIVLEQLRLIRADLARMETRMDNMATEITDIKTNVQGQTGMIMALAGYVRDIDVRVEHLEEAIGAKQ